MFVSDRTGIGQDSGVTPSSGQEEEPSTDFDLEEGVAAVSTGVVCHRSEAVVGGVTLLDYVSELGDNIRRALVLRFQHMSCLR